MRRTKPPVGWERAKNCFPVPNELLDFDLPAGAVAVYICLLRHANRKTNQCHPSEAIIAKKLHLSRNTVAKHVRLLEERGLIVTEHTTVITKQGVKRNGNCDVTRSVSKMTEIERRGGNRWDKPKKAGKSRDCRGGKF